jgi:hypothetical protein
LAVLVVCWHTRKGARGRVVGRFGGGQR